MEQTQFRIEELLGIGFTLVVLGIGLAYGLQVMGDVRDDMGDESCGARSDEFTTYNTSTHNCQNATTGAANTDQVPVGDSHFNATGEGIEGVAKIPEKLPTIVTVIVASVIIGILVTYLWARFR